MRSYFWMFERGGLNACAESTDIPNALQTSG